MSKYSKESGVEKELHMPEQKLHREIQDFKVFFEEHKAMVYNLSYDLSNSKEDAEDLTQEVFIKIFKSIGSFRGEAALKTWIYRITLNTWISHKRSRFFKFRKMQDQGDENLDNKYSQHPDPLDSIQSQDMQKQIRSALGGLSNKERGAFILRHYHDLSIKEVADSMEISAGTVKSLLFRGTKKLKKRLDQMITEM